MAKAAKPGKLKDEMKHLYADGGNLDARQVAGAYTKSSSQDKAEEANCIATADEGPKQSQFVHF